MLTFAFCNSNCHCFHISVTAQDIFLSFTASFSFAFQLFFFPFSAIDNLLFSLKYFFLFLIYAYFNSFHVFFIIFKNTTIFNVFICFVFGSIFVFKIFCLAHLFYSRLSVCAIMHIDLYMFFYAYGNFLLVMPTHLQINHSNTEHLKD